MIVFRTVLCLCSLNAHIYDTSRQYLFSWVADILPLLKYTGRGRWQQQILQVLHPVLRPLTQEGHHAVRAGSEKDLEDDQRAGASFLLNGDTFLFIKGQSEDNGSTE